MRLFVAVWPSAEVVEALASLERPALAGVRWTLPEHWHVTLRFFGELPGPEKAALALERADLGRIERPVALVGPATEVLNGRVLCLPVEGLEQVASAVTKATARVGRPPQRRPFRGHLTLARAARAGARTLRELAGAGFEARFSPGSLALVASVLEAGGPRYEVLERYPLGQGAAAP